MVETGFGIYHHRQRRNGLHLSGGDLDTWIDSFILDVRGMEDFNQTLRNGMITHTGPDVVI
jgi:hypothetical protein